ncbi:hypothetical protein [Mycoplasma leachii]|uniref:hypothetical protein n=1 Tax=Mycoplasma leachii TaxID=2105 RepID=UPI003DA2C127
MKRLLITLGSLGLVGLIATTGAAIGIYKNKKQLPPPINTKVNKDLENKISSLTSQIQKLEEARSNPISSKIGLLRSKLNYLEWKINVEKSYSHKTYTNILKEIKEAETEIFKLEISELEK